MVLVLLLGSVSSVQAEVWEVQITPYSWLTGLKGEVGVLPLDVDLSFGDVLKDLKSSGMLLASVQNGPWSVFFDTTFSDLSSREPLNGPVFSELVVDTKTTTYSLALGHRLMERSDAFVDGYVGLRAWHLDNAVKRVRTDGQITIVTDQKDWVDPLLGVTGSLQISETWTVFSALEIGGGFGGADHEWSLLFGGHYALNDWFSATLGWRHLDVKYQENNYVYSTVQSGPVLGATFRF
ncbi:hypothetical protein J7382_04125 [Shimia sp. R11_0]|uniref:hypothetical protein n=1 Tax=Shimia sp. R11_0 TaxID=2821096 RepID=UPI001AD98BFE|nr:hypothetical protein [Shimia sp. R11_0]MBO9476716.1 hypothetical protein [Shimia sp. R11_0]